jgi:hypothetical protein
MPRRAPYTKLVKHNQQRAAHVKGQGDRLYRLVSCLNLECEANFLVPDETVHSGAIITCPTCGYEHQRGRATKFADYELLEKATGKVLSTGPFEITHDAYLDAAPSFKYCIICSTSQPAANFDTHSSRRTGLQGECRVCKQVYNDIKNESRLPEQHREAADYRRMMVEFAREESTRLDLAELYSKFKGACYKCGRSLAKTPGGPDGYYVDHTLPAKYLWPLVTGPTLLCRICNGNKAEKWPSQFYTAQELKRLSVLTDIAYEALQGNPRYNPAALTYLEAHADAVIERWIAYPDRLQQLRQRIYEATGNDVFASATSGPSSVAIRRRN